MQEAEKTCRPGVDVCERMSPSCEGSSTARRKCADGCNLTLSTKLPFLFICLFSFTVQLPTNLNMSTKGNSCIDLMTCHLSISPLSFSVSHFLPDNVEGRINQLWVTSLGFSLQGADFTVAQMLLNKVKRLLRCFPERDNKKPLSVCWCKLHFEASPKVQSASMCIFNQQASESVCGAMKVQAGTLSPRPKSQPHRQRAVHLWTSSAPASNTSRLQLNNQQHDGGLHIGSWEWRQVCPSTSKNLLPAKPRQASRERGVK